MGRRLMPFPSEPHHSLIHSALFISLAVAWIAAAMAAIVSLCVHRKPSSKPSSPSTPSTPSNDAPKPASETTTTAQATPQEEDQPHQEAAQEEPMTIIEMAPDVATHGPIPPTVLPESVSKRKLSLSFGRGLPEKIRTSRREKTGNGSVPEDTIWKKPIILGEKCKVSSDDEEEEAVVVDEKGNRQRYYHPRTPRSRQTSRNNSFTNPDETSSS